jgi:hypothetical protein
VDHYFGLLAINKSFEQALQNHINNDELFIELFCIDLLLDSVNSGRC